MTQVRLPIFDTTSEPMVDRVRAFAGALRPAITGEVRLDRANRLLYATDASIYQMIPLAVVLPRSTDELTETVRTARRFHLPILPRGGGTSLAGQTVNHAVVIDCSFACNRIINIDVDRRRVRVEPGVVLDDLNRALADDGLMFGPDVATALHANIGGMIGNNSAGAHSVLYGRTVDHVEALDVILADGTALHFGEGAADTDARVHAITAQLAGIIRPIATIIRQRYPGTLRHVNGYALDRLLDQFEASTSGTFDRVNLAHLLCGSEGTLAVTQRATLRCVERPRAVGLAIVSFDAVDEALKAVMSLLATGPSAVELIDDMVLTAARANAQCAPYVDLLPRMGGRDPMAVLYVEYFAPSHDNLVMRLHNLRLHFGARRVRTYTEPTAIQDAWTLRKSGEPLLYGLPGDRKPLTFIEDLAVDPAVLPEFITAFRSLLDRHGTTASYYAHASVGCLHIRPRINLHDVADRARMQHIAEEAADLVRSFGGSLSGEHGDGRLRSHLLERFYGPTICRAFSQVKNVFDPEHRLNPGNIVSPVPMTAALRVQPEDTPVGVADVPTYFRYDAERGFGRAIEQCNGAGVCRKTSGGTMCPSYRVTKDERHATRGRGNALRLAVTGQLFVNTATPIWDDLDTLETLDLCLGCKACKSECPSNVDIARLKSEYLAQSYDQRGCVPLAARVFSRVREVNRIGTVVPWISNWINRRAPWRWLLAQTLRIDTRRSLPRFERPPFAWMRRNARRSSVPPDAPTVLLFADCFASGNETRILRAAVRSLEALGYRIKPVTSACCGRSMISLGRLPEAVATITVTARRLIETARDHDAVAIIGLEPSCVSAIVDDWVDLHLPIPHDDMQHLARLTMSIEQFIDARWHDHPNATVIRDTCDSYRRSSEPPMRVVVQPHCHQRALWGTTALQRVFERLLIDVEMLDEGCCGMAGSFGMLREHYDLSMAIGELGVLPAVREAWGTMVVAPGTSCRHQILDGTGRHALHPIEVIESALLSRCPA